MRHLINLIETANRISAIEREAYEMGVDTQISDRKDYIALLWIKTITGERGAARVVLNVLNRYADDVGKPIHLLVIESKPKLISYYESLGFEIIEVDHNGDTAMVRTPK